MNVLVVGQRKGLLNALKGMNVSYSVWPNRNEHPVTHVIAGTESSVVQASILRREHGARMNPHSTVEKFADKLKMKEFLSSYEIPMTDFMDSKNQLSTDEVFETLGSPVVVKPRIGSGGRGQVHVSDPSELKSFQVEGNIFEKKVLGSEGSVESFIVDRKIQFTNITNYLHAGEMNLLPFAYSSSIEKQILSLNQKVISAFELEWGMTHLEYFISGDRVIFGEVALRPPGGYLMDLLKLSYGFDPWLAFANIELGLKPQLNTLSREYAVSYIIPRQEGVVKEISGSEFVKQLSSLKKLRIRVKPGDVLEKRQGVSDSCGYALFSSPDSATLIQESELARENLKVVIE